MTKFEDFFSVLVIIAILGFFAFTVYSAFADRTQDVCNEHCKPYKVLACNSQESHFFSPKRVNVLIVCDGIETKKVDIIKE